MKKIFYMPINRVCNNNCSVCAFDPETTPQEQKPLDEIKEEIRNAASQGYELFHPIGGETTLHPDLLEILQFGGEHIKELALTTNGRRFSSRIYAEKFKDINAYLCVTLWGPDKRTHESLTRSPGSFVQTIKGMKNLSDLGRTVCINLPLWKRSNDQLQEYLKIIKHVKPTELGLLSLGPFKRAKDLYHMQCPTLFDYAKQLNAFIPKALQLVREMDVEDFPLCVFNQQHLANGRLHFQDISCSVYLDSAGRVETVGLFAADELGYSINTLEMNQQDLGKMQQEIGQYKTHVNACEGCAHKGRCKGVYREYINWRGEEKVEKEVTLLRRLNQVGQHLIKH